MLPLLLGVFLVLAPADTTDQQNRCGELHREAFSINPFEESLSPEQLHWFVEKIREVKTCYGNAGVDYYHRGTHVTEVWALHQLGRIEEALAITNAFFDRFDPSSDARWFGRMYTWRGHLLHLSGNLAEAVPDYTRALDFKLDWESEELPGLYLEIGSALGNIRDFDNARRFFQVVDSMVLAIDDPSATLRIFRARSLRLQANAIIEETDFRGIPDSAAYAQAGQLVETSLAIVKHDKADEEAAHALILLSESKSFLGDIEAARRYLDQAERIILRQNDGYLPIHLQRKKGRFFMQLGHFEASQRAFEEALKLARTTPNISLDVERRIFRDMGHLAEVQGDYARAA